MWTIFIIEIHKRWDFKQIKYPYICIRMGKKTTEKTLKNKRTIISEFRIQKFNYELLQRK